MNEGHTKEELISAGLNENLSVVENNVSIENSILEGSLNFSNVLFNGSVDFSGTNFSNFASFSGTNFNNSVDFSYANFNNFIDFSGTNFSNFADFSRTNFNDFAVFSRVNFNNVVDFSYANFNNVVDFSYANFNNVVDFTYTNFKNSTNFAYVNFVNSAYFSGTNISDYTVVTADEILNKIKTGEDVKLVNCKIFGELDLSEVNLSDAKIETVRNPYFYKLLNEGYDKEELISAGFNERSIVIKNNITIKNSLFENPLNFSNVLFNNSVDFSNVKFSSSTNFSYANFNGSADFSETIFFDSAYFYGTKFDEYANFHRAEFNHPCDFSMADFNDLASFRGPDKSENIITDGKTCELFKDYYKNEARYVDADNIYYNYRRHSQEQKSLLSLSKYTDFLSWIVCGYGIRITHTLYCGVVIIMVFTYFYRPHTTVSVTKSKNKVGPIRVYWKDSIIYRLSDAPEKKSILSYWDALHFSISTFTSMGSGGLYIRNNFRKYATIEGLLGYIMLGIFMATLSNILRISNLV